MTPTDEAEALEGGGVTVETVRAVAAVLWALIMVVNGPILGLDPPEFTGRAVLLAGALLASALLNRFLAPRLRRRLVLVLVAVWVDVVAVTLVSLQDKEAPWLLPVALLIVIALNGLRLELAPVAMAVVAAVLAYLYMAEVVEVRPTVARQVTAGVVLVIMGIVAYGTVLLGRRLARRALAAQRVRLEEQGRAQREILDGLDGIQPTVDAVVRQVRQVGENLATQAAQQVESSNVVVRSTEALRDMVASSVEAVDEARRLAGRSRHDALDSRERLREVEASFRSTVAFVRSLRSEISGLAESAVQTDRINDTLADISERLRYLALNASIEAVSAGEFGKGFAVVAGEMGRMLEATASDLQRSRALLRELQSRAEGLSGAADHSVAQLELSFSALESAGELNGAIAASVEETAERFEVVAGAAGEQQRRIVEVAGAMAQLDQVSASMLPAASTLTEGMAAIATSQDDLRRLLARRQGPVEAEG